MMRKLLQDEDDSDSEHHASGDDLYASEDELNCDREYSDFEDSADDSDSC